MQRLLAHSAGIALVQPTSLQPGSSTGPALPHFASLASGPASSPFGAFEALMWGLYLVAALMLPMHHVRPVLRYMRGNNGIDDACIRSKAMQCLWRVPALLFSVFVAPSLPLFLSIFFDLLGRVARVLEVQGSRRRHAAAQAADSASSASPTVLWPSS